jgi:hypothetical protein
MGSVHADVALGLLFGIVEGMGVEKRPDELAADIFQAEFEMGVLIDGVVTAKKSGGTDVEPLFVVYFLRSDEAGRVAGACGGDGGVEGMGESIAESDARWSGLDEFGRITGTEHARLSGHVGESILHGREGKNLKQRTHEDTRNIEEEKVRRTGRNAEAQRKRERM